MSSTSDRDRAVTPAFLEAFAEAWNRPDTDALMSIMSEDCVFNVSAGLDACVHEICGASGRPR